jgi:non-specific serine/threonine protein kinase
MALLTPDNLYPYNLTYYDHNAYTRGRAYYNDGRVSIVTFDGQSATCRVRGDHGIYTVSIEAETKKQIVYTCNCPQAEKADICKHVVASAFAVHDFILHSANERWQYRLSLALESVPKAKAKGPGRMQYAIVFGLLSEKYANGSISYHMYPYQVRALDWVGIRKLEVLTTQEDRNQAMDKDRAWAAMATQVTRKMDSRSVVNLPPEAVQLTNLMVKISAGAYFGVPDLANYLPLLANLEAPLFRMTGHNTFKERLHFQLEPARIEAALARDGENFLLHAGVSMGGEIFTTLKDSFHLLSDDPAWALAGKTVVPVENVEALSVMNYLPLTIPAKDAPEFREKYLPILLERFPVKGDLVTWDDVDSDPVPRLYLADDGGKLQAGLRFGYGDYEVDMDPKANAVTLRNLPGEWGMVRIHRRMEQEDNFSQLLTDSQYGLKRAASSQPPGTYGLRARIHPFDFMLHSIPRLAQAGFEIYGEENLKAGKINRATPTISLNISTGLDWFDVQATIHYGDQEVSLRDVRRALLKREGFIKLADGSIGQIPPEWLERYRRLFDMAEEKGDSLRVRDFHLPLVDTLLADAGEKQVAVEFEQRRKNLLNFDQIQSQPMPQGFTGELRPYQKAGLDWLHFLNQYGFGGCLADDMGLGKTIEVLALLQSLKEQGKAKTPSLLVVPKSLIANWQREGERFTPGLRMLEFTGNSRKKDPALFAEYDVVLTTYGTMLRDVEFLRETRFNYAILDESQAIKNPLALSSKAARLLNADHRLAMTGTPVENNTFELWSQFAFLNPGLLGSVEYFKREFAKPIESEGSEDTTRLLRRLVYPFILRRTKDQVAPELPPRSERILYTDFDPAQRKLYAHTRDHYRGLLLGMIDTEGIDDVRMKILEGLLRLRQICIHPALVEPTYRGESAKFELLLETLETLHGEGHKALVFSQFVQSLHLLQRELDARHLPYAYLDGQTKERQGEVDRFQRNPAIPFFLISLKAGGVGLNLTAADYVIHLDPWWNPAVEMQAADRAHRIGQDKPVFIYRIITRDTVEDKILKLQEHKRELVSQLISPEGSFFKKITREDVQALFS